MYCAFMGFADFIVEYRGSMLPLDVLFWPFGDLCLLQWKLRVLTTGLQVAAVP